MTRLLNGVEMPAILVFLFQEITQIREEALQSRTIRKSFADRGILPYKPELVIDRLVAQQTPEPELQTFDGHGGASSPVIMSSIPSGPANRFSARCTRDKLNHIADLESIPEHISRQLRRVGRSQVYITEDNGLLVDTLENQLPKKPTIARRSQKQLGKFGALTTKDSVRHARERNTRDEKKMSIRRSAAQHL